MFASDWAYSSIYESVNYNCRPEMKVPRATHDGWFMSA